MDRKSIKVDVVDEALLSHNSLNRRLMNEIMYQLRRLMKLVRRVQTLTIREGSEDFNMIQNELMESRKVITEIEKELEGGD